MARGQGREAQGQGKRICIATRRENLTSKALGCGSQFIIQKNVVWRH